MVYIHTKPKQIISDFAEEALHVYRRIDRFNDITTIMTNMEHDKTKSGIICLERNHNTSSLKIPVFHKGGTTKGSRPNNYWRNHCQISRCEQKPIIWTCALSNRAWHAGYRFVLEKVETILSTFNGLSHHWAFTRLGLFIHTLKHFHAETDLWISIFFWRGELENFGLLYALGIRVTERVYSSGVASTGTCKGTNAPPPLDSEKIAKNRGKTGKPGKKRGRSGKNRKKEEKSGRKGNNREGSFTLLLLKDRAGYGTGLLSNIILEAEYTGHRIFKLKHYNVIPSWRFWAAYKLPPSLS